MVGRTVSYFSDLRLPALINPGQPGEMSPAASPGQQSTHVSHHPYIPAPHRGGGERTGAERHLLRVQWLRAS